MYTEVEIQDLDRAMNLLEEYTERTKKIYRELSSDRRQRIMSIYIIAAMMLFLTSLLFAFRAVFESKSTDTTSFYVFMLFISFAAIGMALTQWYISRKKESTTLQKDDLRISYKQLKSLTSLISQYFEHNI